MGRRRKKGERGRRRVSALALALCALGSIVGLPYRAAASATETFSGVSLYFYWGVRCTHCEVAKPFLVNLARQYPELTVVSIEVQEDAEGRQRFLEHMTALGVSGGGVPTFVVGQTSIAGFEPGRTEALVENAIRAAAGVTPTDTASPPSVIDLPLFGSIDSRAISFPVFTVLVGLVDGLNPCAFWVLTVMMSILLHVRSRLRLALFGGLFVVTSGVVYFLFMVAWTTMFTLAGMSLWLTRGLGIGLLVMGLVNLKELIWFGKGPSLMIPAAAKPGLYGRMRSITNAASLPAALVGIVALAFVVNLIELGCTIGLPAVYTRILTLQPDLGSAGRYAYLALYNLAYVVPLGLVVVLYTVTLYRFTLSERGAKALKLISGVLLVSFGILFLARPEILG